MSSIVTIFDMDCELGKFIYSRNNQPALKLVAADTSNNQAMGIFHGEPVMTATVCVDYPFEEGETAIKDYGENAGILRVLLDSKIVELTGKSAICGLSDAPIVKLLI